jgi:hypothetical protein
MAIRLDFAVGLILMAVKCYTKEMTIGKTRMEICGLKKIKN